MAKRGHAGLFEPALRWMRKKVKASGKHHHVYRGEVRSSRRTGLRGTGWHHRFMGQDPPDRKVIRITSRGIGGTYTADVAMRGGTTKNTWYIKPGGSSFFPDNWTPQRVNRAIREAYANSTPVPNTNNRRWRGVSNGLLIEGSYSRKSKTWDSAWPIVQPL
ncbi:EndoU domain-containing protein [Asanoa siamensis]|uniref:Bacterial EndoU nuclease domain-containing protein n=1 Tax=Asanoa siamensis TaxID=926357 RepID=A0ABQ4D4H8_9ACTN|nr:EndoU domain-containing protein [Asanoa siamensis]GIF78440.1 hypothetical protein Asi02nite_79580 [Asanoa siamensis]